MEQAQKKDYRTKPEVMEMMMTPMPHDRVGFIEEMTKRFKIIYGSGLPLDEGFHRELVATYYDRCFCPEGAMLQYLAIATQKDRTQQLSQLKITTLVIHGNDDPMVPLAGGEATAAAIPNATLKIVKGMGHVMPNLNAYWSDILEDMVEHMKKVGS